MSRKAKALSGIFITALFLTGISRFIRLPLLGIHPEEAVPNQMAMLIAFQKGFLKTGALPSILLPVLPDALQEDLAGFEEIFDDKLAIPGNQRLLAAIQPSRTSGIDVMFVMDGAREIDLESILTTAEEWQVRTSVFKKRNVYTVKTGSQSFALAKYHNLLLFGRHAYLLENAISQIKSPSSCLCRDSGFKKMVEKARQQDGHWNLFVQLDQLSAQFAPLIQPSSLGQVATLGHLGHWLSLEIPVKKKVGAWQGAFTANASNAFVKANHGAKALPFKNVFRALPDNLTGFGWMVLDGFKPAKHAGLWRDYFKKWSGNEIAFAIGEPLDNKTQEQFIILKTSADQKAEAGLEALAKKMGQLGTDKYQMFTVRQIMGSEVAEMFGASPALSNPYVAVLGEYVLFANSKSGLERWLDKFIAGQTFSKSVAFLQMLRSQPVDALGFLYVESGKAWQQLAPMLDNKVEASLGGNPMRFGQLAVAFQRNGAHYAYMATIREEGAREESKPANILWKAPLAAPAAIAPVVFENPENGETELFVQDESNQLYLISRSGRIIWRRNIGEPILSKVTPIDLFSNNEGQLVFSTLSKIYIIARDGSDVDGYPLELQTPATNGVTVVDFFKSHDYQFFIACENGSAYGFDEKGSPVEGWRPHENVGAVRLPLLHFQAGGMDFMALLDETGRFQVYQKNGGPRFAPKEWNGAFQSPLAFQSLKNSSRIVACDNKGKISIANLAGDEFKLSLKVGDNTDVRFAFADVVGDERNDYLAVSGKEAAVYYYEGKAFKKSFAHRFQNAQDEVFPVRWRGGKKAYVGTVCKSKSQIHLLDGKGQILPQFPLAGTTSFLILDLMVDGNAVLVVGNGPDVYAYGLN